MLFMERDIMQLTCAHTPLNRGMRVFSTFKLKLDSLTLLPKTAAELHLEHCIFDELMH